MYIINWLSDFDLIKYPVTYYVNKATIGAKLSLSLNIWFRFLFLSLNWLTEYHWNKFVTHSAAEQARWERCGCTKIPMNHTQYKKTRMQIYLFLQAVSLTFSHKELQRPPPTPCKSQLHLFQEACYVVTYPLLYLFLMVITSIPIAIFLAISDDILM